MNPARSLAPALLSAYLGDLWIYLSAPFVGTSLVAFMIRKKISMKN
ncbi:MAG: aquaporin [Nitrososphaeraceae archaeon]|nr:aquaporin [Nitrososphaeraceae archaeon]